MKKDNIFSIVIMSCGALLILSVFLPYVSYFSTTASLWKIEDPSRFIYILLGLLVIFLYLVNKRTEMAYLAAGYGTFSTIGTIMSLGGFNGLSVAFYVLLLSSITIGILTFLYNEEEADALINLSLSVNKTVMNNNGTIDAPNENNSAEKTQINLNDEPVTELSEESIIETPITSLEDKSVNRPVHFNPMTDESSNTNNN